MRRFLDILREAERESNLAELTARGFNVEEKLYHGSRFDHKRELEAGHGRTSHIYLSPDPRNAAYYGAHIHECVGRQEPQADLRQESPLLYEIAVEFSDYFPEEEVVDLILGGVTWEKNLGGRTFQDALMSYLFEERGYRSVRKNDVSITGESISVVFNNSADVVVIREFMWGHDA